MRLLSRLLFLLVLCAAAPAAQAAITVNEVAWMGTATSANDEWIELYNDGEAELVDGWVLSDGMNLTITLTGTIAAHSYAVLERTDDDTVAGSAFMVYTGSLVNTGATLTLKRSDGSLADQVAGGADWSAIGGDNVTKETAQYTGSGWVTAVPTPGAQNSTVSQIPPDTEDDDDDSTSAAPRSGGGGGVAKSRAAEPVVLHAVPSEPTVRIFMPATLYVNQEVEATAVVSTIGKTIAQSMEYQWNFGDITTGTGKIASHRYAYPGEYIVSVRAAYKDFVTIDKVAVTVLPLALSMTRNAAGDLQVHNNAKYEIDVSLYVVTGAKMVTFPAHTYVAPNATITIPRRSLGITNTTLLLKDSVGQTVAFYSPSTPTMTSTRIPSPPPIAKLGAAVDVVGASAPESVRETNFSFRTTAPGAGIESGTSTADQVVSFAASATPAPLSVPLSAAAETGAPVSTEPFYPYVGLAAVIGVALLAAIAGGSKAALPATTQMHPGSDDGDSLPFR